MLTMRIAEDALSGFRTVTQIHDGAARLDGIRFGVSPHTADYLSVSQDKSDILLTHNLDNIRVPDAGLDEVANAVLAFTERLSRWETELNTLIYENAPLQALIDRSLEHFLNPIFIIDETNTVRARTTHELGMISDDWDCIVQHNRMPIERVRAIYNSNQIDWFSTAKNSRPFLFSPPGMAHRGINFRIPSANRNTYIGTLIIIEHETPVTIGMLQYASILADAVFRWVCRHDGERLMHTASDTLSDLLGGIKPSGEALHTLEHIVSPSASTYRIACAVSRDAVRVSQYLHHVEEKLPHCICCENDEFLVILFDDAQKTENLKTLDALFRNIPVVIGVSNVYSDLSHSASSLRQAQIAVRCGNKKISELNAESVMKYIAAEVSSSLGGSDVIHPALLRLKNYDLKHGTHMYDTLHVLLKNERSLAMSLLELKIHRNSLIYRLERIEQITGCDLDDPDVRDWLLFSFRMAENNHP